jgi:hypothetical protein
MRDCSHTVEERTAMVADGACPACIMSSLREHDHAGVPSEDFAQLGRETERLRHRCAQLRHAAGEAHHSETLVLMTVDEMGLDAERLRGLVRALADTLELALPRVESIASQLRHDSIWRPLADRIREDLAKAGRKP